MMHDLWLKNAIQIIIKNPHKRVVGCWVSRLITVTFAYRKNAHWWYTFGVSLTLACVDALNLDGVIDRGLMDNLETNRQAKRNIHLYLARCIFACYVSSEGVCDTLSATTQWVSRYKHIQICTWHRFALAKVDYQPMVSMFASNWRELPCLTVYHVSPELFCDIMKTVANRYVAKD